MHHKLKQDAVRGMGWAFASSTSVRALQIITTLTLAKLLIPADFGIFSLASIITNAMLILPDIGFAQALIYQREGIKESANTAFILSTATSVSLAVILFFSAPMLGSLFSTHAIIAPMRVMAWTVAISGSTTVPLSLLDRELKFSKRAIPEVSAAFVYASVSITLAAMRFGAWSMVIGWTAMSITNAVATWCVCSWRPSLKFSAEGSRVIFDYGKHLVVATFASFAFLQIDNASVGKWLGVTALGFYSIAFTVCNLPATNLTAVVNRVMFPTYSRLNGDMAEIKSVYLRALKYLASAAFPAAVLLMVLSGPFIRLCYGKKWEGAIPLFHVLAVYGLSRALGATSEAVFMATGHPELVRKVTMTQLTIGALLVYPAAVHFGVMGVAVLFTIAYISGTMYGFVNIGKMLKINTLGWMSTLKTPAISGIVALFAAISVANGLAETNILNIAITFAAIICTYGASIYIIDRSAYSEMRSRLLKSKRKLA